MVATAEEVIQKPLWHKLPTMPAWYCWLGVPSGWSMQVEGPYYSCCHCLYWYVVGYYPNRQVTYTISSNCLHPYLSKNWEQEDLVPKVSTLNSYSGNAYPHSLVLKMESWILNTFKWEVNVLTTVNFLEYYLQTALHPNELASNNHLRNYETTKAHICKTAEFFVALSEHHCYFREILPSVVAASAIAAARQMLHIQPVWTDALQIATCHNMGNIVDCTTSLLSYYQQTFPSSGYWNVFYLVYF